MTDISKYFPDGLQIDEEEMKRYDQERKASELFEDGFSIKEVSIEFKITEFESAQLKRKTIMNENVRTAFRLFVEGYTPRQVSNILGIKRKFVDRFYEIYEEDKRRHES
tara:strand:- start:45 stop:371 length:327 start_codon:yes stop_codon:yes gene_type:complete